MDVITKLILTHAYSLGTAILFTSMYYTVHAYFQTFFFVFRLKMHSLETVYPP